MTPIACITCRKEMKNKTTTRGYECHSVCDVCLRPVHLRCSIPHMRFGHRCANCYNKIEHGAETVVCAQRPHAVVHVSCTPMHAQYGHTSDPASAGSEDKRAGPCAYGG